MHKLQIDTIKTSFKSKNNALVLTESELDQLFDITLTFPFPKIFCWFKDKKSRYIRVNEAHAMEAGIDSPHQIIGKDDFEMVWRNYAGFYQASDQQVLSGEMVYSSEVEVVPTINGTLNMLVTKYQLLNNKGECLGVAGINLDATGYCMLKKAGQYDAEKGILYLGSIFNNNYLTRRELDVLKLLISGFTAKRIGLDLNISYRTVEDYIYVLKDKLDCESKSEIVIKAIKNGLTYLIFE